MKKNLAKFFYRLGDRLALGYDAADSSRLRRDLGWGRQTERDEDATVGPDSTREKLRLKGTDLRRNNPVVAGVCDRLASFVVGTGIHPQARTSNPEWNRAAEENFNNWSKTCDSRGRESLWSLQRMAVGLRPVHGGLYFELLENGQIRPIECERIRQPASAETAKAFTDGVKVDRKTGIVLGYMIHSRDAQGAFGQKHVESFVWRENIVPVIRPPWRADQVREIPDMAPIIPALQDIQDANTYTLNTYKVQSMIIGALKKQNGMGLNSAPRGSSTPTVGQRQTFKFDWGQVLEMFPNEDMSMTVSPTPNQQHIPYMKMQLLLCASALDLPYEFFTLDFSTADFSRMKAVLLLVNRSMRGWQKWLNESMNQRLWNWHIAKAIKNGDLPPAPLDANGISEWYKVDWQAPEEPWIDRQEANQADMLEWQLGLGPLSSAAKRRGTDLEDSLREKARILKLAAQIEKESELPEGSLIKAQIPGQTEFKKAERLEAAPKAEVENEE